MSQAGTPSTTSTCAWAPGDVDPTGPAARCGWRMAHRSATPGSCSRPAPRRAGCRCPAPTWPACWYLRTLGDSEALSAVLKGGGHVVIAGAGWIGLEVAAAARQAGCEVTVVEPTPRRSTGGSGLSSARSSPTCTAATGVTFRLGEAVSELHGDVADASGSVGAPRGSVRQVLTSAGTEIAADLVIAGIGAVRMSAWRLTPGWRSTTASWWMSRCAPRTRTSSRPATWRTRSTRCSATGSGGALVQRAERRARRGPGPCWAGRFPTTGCPISSVTSTTWAWRPPGCPSPALRPDGLPG